MSSNKIRKAVFSVAVTAIASALPSASSPLYSAENQPLEAGVAVVDITPPVPYRMCGYFNERTSTGIHDPLFAKALVLKQGDLRVALVFCDLIGITQEINEQARQLAQEQTGIPGSNICIAAIHSHTGPLYSGVLRNHFHDKAVAKDGSDLLEKIDYPAQLKEKIAQAIVAAAASLQPVTVRAGIASQEGLSFNRRFHMKNAAEVVFNPGIKNPDIIRPAGPIDPDVGILLLNGASENLPLASLTVFALHLDTVGGTLYGADYPAVLQNSLRAEFGDKFVSLFGTGTCGDINHIDVSNAAVLKTEEIGNRLAATVKEFIPKLKAVEQPSLAVLSSVVEVPIQKCSTEEIAWAKEMMEKVGDESEPFLPRVKAYKIMDLQLRGESLPIEVQVFRLNADTAIVALPGEVFVDLGLAIKKASPFATTLVFELAGDAPEYIPTTKAFQEGSYETVNSQIQPGGGEIMVKEAISLLEKLHK